MSDKTAFEFVAADVFAMSITIIPETTVRTYPDEKSFWTAFSELGKKGFHIATLDSVNRVFYLEREIKHEDD